MSLSRSRPFRCVSWAADVAEAVFDDVPIGGKVQVVDHVVVAAHDGSIDPRPLNYVKLEGSFQKTPALSVVIEDEVAARECIANDPPGMW